MDESAAVPRWYAEARRRAVASGRRARAAASSGSAEWPEFAPPVALAEGPLGAVQAADREIARQTALRARALAEFAATRPASADRPQGVKGAMSPERWAARPEILREVSEWAAPELSIACSLSQPAAQTLLERSLLLVHRLPGTLAALQAGALHPGHLWPLLEHVAPIADDAVRAEVEAVLLRWAAGRVTTPAQLGDKARRELLARDLRAASRRLARALAERGVSLRAERVDGMAALLVSGTVPEAQALYAALGAYADALPDDGRTRGQKMLDCLLELVLRPGECELPPVRVLLTVVASMGTLAGGDAPGEINGQPVPAELVRALLQGLGPNAPSAPEAPGSGLCWQEEEQNLLAAWSEELTERILAGEFDDPSLWNDDRYRDRALDELDPELDPELGPEFGPEVDPERCPPAVDLLDALDPDDGLPADDLSPDDGPPRPDRSTQPEEPPESAPPDTRPADRGAGDGGRWWADADRAVAAAGVAVRDADAALGHARRLVATAQRADAADETAWRTSPAGRITAAPDALGQLAAATDTQRAWLADLLAATAGGGLAERPRLALTDAVTGALLALTDLPGLRRAAHCGRPACRRRPAACAHDLTGRPGLGPPGPTDGYRPGADLDRYLRARDRRCRFPGCRRRVPTGGELDHNRRYPDGPTAAANLAGYCTPDHRGKHQAPGWRHHLAPDGTLTVTTPSGLTAVTTPPPY